MLCFIEAACYLKSYYFNYKYMRVIFFHISFTFDKERINNGIVIKTRTRIKLFIILHYKIISFQYVSFN